MRYRLPHHEGLFQERPAWSSHFSSAPWIDLAELDALEQDTAFAPLRARTASVDTSEGSASFYSYYSSEPAQQALDCHSTSQLATSRVTGHQHIASQPTATPHVMSHATSTVPRSTTRAHKRAAPAAATAPDKAGERSRAKAARSSSPTAAATLTLEQKPTCVSPLVSTLAASPPAIATALVSAQSSTCAQPLASTLSRRVAGRRRQLPPNRRSAQTPYSRQSSRGALLSRRALETSCPAEPPAAPTPNSVSHTSIYNIESNPLLRSQHEQLHSPGYARQHASLSIDSIHL